MRYFCFLFLFWLALTLIHIYSGQLLRLSLFYSRTNLLYSTRKVNLLAPTGSYLRRLSPSTPLISLKVDPSPAQPKRFVSC